MDGIQFTVFIVTIFWTVFLCKFALSVNALPTYTNQNPAWSCDHNFTQLNPISGGCDWKSDAMLWGESNLLGVSDLTGNGALGDSVLQVFYPKGSYYGKNAGAIGDVKGGTEFFARPFQPATTVIFQYQVYFSDNFNWCLGGKLPGLYGGSGRCESGKASSSECFSIRFEWTRDGFGELDVYNPADSTPDFCYNRDVSCDFADGHTFARRSFMFTTGMWQTISMEVNLNSVGQEDGSIKVNHNGYMVYDVENLIFRNSEAVNINAIFFSTYFGGSGGENNAIFSSLGNVYAYFKDFQVFTRGEVEIANSEPFTDYY